MRILVAVATAAEAAPLAARLGSALEPRDRLVACARAGHELHLLVTGVGMVATAAWCARTLARTPYDLALNIGVCGSFDRSIGCGAVVHVVSDRVAELGAQDGAAFLPIEELGLADPEGRAHSCAELRNPAPPDNAALKRLPRVSGITVNTVHGDDESIAAVVARFNPQIESMEGAAFMYACLMHGVPFAQVRAVSNIVERRNRAAWRIDDAIDALGAAAFSIVEAL